MQYDDTSDTSLGGHTVDSKILYAELLKYGGYRQGAIRRLSASQLTPLWLKNNGTFRPVLIPAPEGGAAAAIVKTPAGGISAEMLATSLGPTTPVQTFDSPTQEEGPLWTLHQWKLYWNKKTARYNAASKPQDMAPAQAGPETTAAAAPPPPSSDIPLEGINPDYISRLFSLPALQITGTPLESQISPPPAVQQVDLRTTLSLTEATPHAHLPIMLGMYPSKSFVNSAMAPGGASLWIHLVSGTATIALSPPVPKNLATYAAWACGGKSYGLFLPSKCEGSAKAELTAGDTLILPPGYTYSLAVTSSAVVVSGGFLRSDSLATHLDALRIEEAAKMRSHRQYPEFKQLMWHTARKFSILLAGMAGDKLGENFEEKVASRALDMEKEDRRVAEKAAAKAIAQATQAAAATAAKVASRPSSAAGRGGGGGSARRRKRPADDFIQSDSDWSAGFKGNGRGDNVDDDDDEAEWIPGARQHRGIADSQENSGEEEEYDDVLDSDAEEYDFQYSDEDEDEGGGDGYGSKKRRRNRGGKSGTAEGIRVTGERQRKRQREAKSKSATTSAGKDGMAPSPSPAALNLTGMPPSSLKVKLKLPMMMTSATAPGVEQQSKPSPIKLTFKQRPAAPTAPTDAAAPSPTLPAATTIPQVDGPNDDLEDHFLELNEGEEQGLPVLYITLRQWLRKSPVAASTAASSLSFYYEDNNTPWTVLARLELALKSLKLLEVSDEDHPPPVCTNLNAVSIETLEPTGAPFQTLLSIYSTGGGGGGESAGKGNATYGDDEDSLDYESGDNAAMIDEIEERCIDKRGGGGGGGGGDGGGSGRPLSAAANSDGRGASNGGGLALGGIDDGATAIAARDRAKSTAGGIGGGRAPLSKTAAKKKKLSTKDRLKKKLGL